MLYVKLVFWQSQNFTRKIFLEYKYINKLNNLKFEFTIYNYESVFIISINIEQMLRYYYIPKI